MRKIFFLTLALCLAFSSISFAADPAAQMDKASELYNLGKYKQVISMITPLAEQGNADAQVMLGNCYENGLGLGMSPQIACQWYALAAEQGNARAMAKLGYAYAVGNGVPMDFATAVRYMASAAERGDPGAIETLDIWNREGKLN